MVEITPNFALGVAGDLAKGDILGAAENIPTIGNYVKAAGKLGDGDVLGAGLDIAKGVVPGLDLALNTAGSIPVLGDALKSIPVLGGLFGGGGGMSEDQFMQVMGQILPTITMSMMQDEMSNSDQDFEELIGDSIELS